MTTTKRASLTLLFATTTPPSELMCSLVGLLPDDNTLGELLNVSFYGFDLADEDDPEASEGLLHGVRRNVHEKLTSLGWTPPSEHRAGS